MAHLKFRHSAMNLTSPATVSLSSNSACGCYAGLLLHPATSAALRQQSNVSFADKLLKILGYENSILDSICPVSAELLKSSKLPWLLAYRTIVWSRGRVLYVKFNVLLHKVSQHLQFIILAISAIRNTTMRMPQNCRCNAFFNLCPFE